MRQLTNTPADRRGFTLIEIVIAVAIVAVFAAAISPMVFKHLEDAKVSKAQNETEAVSMAIMTLYKDVDHWPITNANGPSGTVDRVLSSNNVPSGTGPAAGSNAGNWGTYGLTKMLGDYLYYNNPDDNSSANGNGQNQNSQDYPTSGPAAWEGPYLEEYSFDDPWGNAYVVNARYFPAGRYTGNTRHKVLVLSAGPNGRWETDFNDGTTEQIRGDDVGTLVTFR
jgi:prepilin-type N-terminal cleavage/methylation domain-containing protein